MKTRSQNLIAPWLLSLAATSAAQSGPATTIPPSVRRGMMSATPVGVLPSTAGASSLLITDPGPATNPPTEWSTARFGNPDGQYPDYSPAAIFGPQAASIVLSGFSTGNDVMPTVYPDGRVNMTQPLWFGLTVSVTNDSAGSPGSHVERLIGSGSSPGAELFTYIASGSVGIDSSLPNTTLSERSREELGLATAPQPVDVKGLDHGLGVIPFDRSNRAGMMFAVRDRFYFALDASCVQALGPSFALDSIGQPVPADAATIYQSKWEPSGAGWAWSQPEVYCTSAQLELNETVDQIDALAVYSGQSRVVFSTQRKSGRNQLLVYQLGQTGAPQTLQTSDGIEFTAQLGLTGDSDVDGTCAIDPVEFLNYSGSVGIPEMAYFVSDKDPLGVSVSRAESNQDGDDSFHIQVTGTQLNDSSLGVVLLFGTDRVSASLGGPLEQPANWAYLGFAAIVPGQGEVNWTFPAIAGTFDLALMAYLAEQGPNDPAPVPTRGSWVSMLRLY